MECNREGNFGEGKHRYSLGLVKTRLQETSKTQIHLAVLVMNLQKILRDLFIFFFPCDSSQKNGRY
ncbi:MAG: transposase [Ruminococcaceae bacterium]|nr:transposase [Oscillospiraceae bacterium]